MMKRSEQAAESPFATLKRTGQRRGRARPVSSFVYSLVVTLMTLSCAQLLLSTPVDLYGERAEREEQAPKSSVAISAEKVVASTQIGAGPDELFATHLAFGDFVAVLQQALSLSGEWARTKIRTAPAFYHSLDPRLTWESNSGPPFSARIS